MSSKEIIESGLLELYALDALDVSQSAIVSDALSNDPVLVRELEQVEQTLFIYAKANAIIPNPTIKPFLMAKIDYIERLRNGEVPERVPVLNADSKISHFDKWLKRGDMQMSGNFDEAQITIMADEPEQMTSIVWLRSGAPPEVHDAEHEKFLIVEGRCDLSIGSTVHALKPGDFLSIPLHISHHVVVTSAIPCKIILQRVKC